MIVGGRLHRIHKVVERPAETVLPPDLIEGINLGDGVISLPRGIRKRKRDDGKK